jgi:hypothetical protein
VADTQHSQAGDEASSVWYMVRERVPQVVQILRHHYVMRLVFPSYDYVTYISNNGCMRCTRRPYLRGLEAGKLSTLTLPGTSRLDIVANDVLHAK